MANAVLHVICGNCGNGDPDMMGVRIYPGDGVDPPCAAISCKNCTTLHFLDGGRFRHQDHRQADQLRARIAELEEERTAILSGLRFYAEQASWSNTWETGDPFHAMEDRGNVARNALQAIDNARGEEG